MPQVIKLNECGAEEFERLQAERLLEEEAEAVEKEVVDAGDNLLKHLDKSVPDIIAILGGLSIEDLDRLQEAEEAGKTRSTLIEALKAERESREGGEE